MSLVLCIESSSEFGLIGLVQGGKTLIEEQIPVRDYLAGALADLLEKNKVEPKEITEIAIGIGPGSFTGLRVGLAWAKGFARVLDIPIWPVHSLKIFAANLENKTHQIAVISSARKNEVYCAIFSPDLSLSMPQSVIPYSELPMLVSDETLLIGPATDKLPPEIKARFAQKIPQDIFYHQAHAEPLARLAALEWKDKTVPDRAGMVPDYGLDFPANPIS